MTLEDFTEFSAESNGDSDDGGAAGTESTSNTERASGEQEADRFESVSVSPTGTDNGLGTLSVRDGLRVATDTQETELRAFITAENRESVRIGKYIIIPYPDAESLFCRITSLEYAQEYHSDDATEIHARRSMRQNEFHERDYKFMASLEPIAVLYTDNGTLKRRMTDRVPKPGATAKQARDSTEIKTGLKIPAEGIFLGHLSVGGEKVRTAASPPTIDYRIKDDYGSGDPLVFRHSLIAGGTGSGKTHASKNVLRQYLSEDCQYPMADGRTVSPAVVLFDPQDEYAQMHDDNPEMTPSFARKLDRENIAYGGHSDTIALVPKEDGVTYGGGGHNADQKAFTIPFSMVRDQPWLVAGSSLNENQYPALLTLLSRFFRNYGESGTYKQFLAFLDDPALKAELDESGRVHEATFDAVKRRVRGIPTGIFDQAATPITDLDQKLVRPGGLTVIPTYHLSTSRAKELFVLAVSSYLIDDKLSNAPESDRIKQTPIVLGMDEAHNFLADADTVQAQKVITKFTEAAKQGRKERLGLFLITQDPQDIAEPVFKQINTKLVLNLGDEDAIKSVNIPTTLQQKVPYMEKGQMVIYSPDNSEPVELIGLSTCLTRHGR
ncbi:ATP-binding protein [Halorubraceae archaeon YAN]|nr:ATP-binding protein [Halorubraceae archaeon YAN]